MFSEFWMLYPKKHAKKYAEKCFNKLSTEEKEAAILGLKKYLKYWEMKSTDSEYIMHPSTFINQARWEDELDFEVKKPKVIEQAWWSSNESMLAEGLKYNTRPKPGESWFEFKGRLIELKKQVA